MRAPSSIRWFVALTLATIACSILGLSAAIQGSAISAAMLIATGMIAMLALAALGIAIVGAALGGRPAPDRPPVESTAPNRHLQLTGRRCLSCGYDLWTTPDRCPECGAEPVWESPPAGGIDEPPVHDA